MNKLILILTIITMPLFAEQTFKLSQGYRHDSLSIESGQKKGNSVKIHFKDVDVYTSRLSFQATQNDLFLKAIAGYGVVIDGKAHTQFRSKSSFYQENFDQTNHLNGDFTADFSLTAGKNYHLPHFTVTPTIGYGVYIQNFHSDHSHRHYSHPSKSIKYNTEERYKASWYSPQVGLQIAKDFTKTLNGSIGYTFLFPLTCQGTTHFSRRNQGHFEVTEQNSSYKSFGNIVTAGCNWSITPNWSLKPEVEMMKFYSHTSSSSRASSFKKAIRSAYEARLTLGYNF